MIEYFLLSIIMTIVLVLLIHDRAINVVLQYFRDTKTQPSSAVIFVTYIIFSFLAFVAWIPFIIALIANYKNFLHAYTKGMLKSMIEGDKK